MNKKDVSGVVLLSPTENSEAMIVNPGTLSFLKVGDTVLLSGPVFSTECYDCGDSQFLVHGKHIMGVKQ